MYRSNSINAMDLSAEERYKFFVSYVKKNELLWGLYIDGWAEATDESQTKGLIVFPEKDTAEVYAKSHFEGYSPKEIKLSSFLGRWVDKLRGQNYDVAVFPTPIDGPKFVDPYTVRGQLD
ncbi:MAG: DUF2750 domain-containing protein [Pirellulales bacterium]|jgi:hypothetical protein